jgi:hypothetical protein
MLINEIWRAGDDGLPFARGEPSSALVDVYEPAASRCSCRSSSYLPDVQLRSCAADAPVLSSTLCAAVVDSATGALAAVVELHNKRLSPAAGGGGHYTAANGGADGAGGAWSAAPADTAVVVAFSSADGALLESILSFAGHTLASSRAKNRLL